METIPMHVVRRYASKNELELESASSLFQELELFLEKASDKNLTPTKVVDIAWHEFILHTKDYMNYCIAKFGKYIHHVPHDTQPLNELADCDSCSAACVSGESATLSSN